jgi:hypothetical protein
MGYHNLIKVSVSTTGTDPITMGAAVSGYLTAALGGVVDQELVYYALEDTGTPGHECGWGIYSSSGTTLTRNVESSTNGGAALILSGTATCTISITAAAVSTINSLEFISICGSQ